MARPDEQSRFSLRERRHFEALASITVGLVTTGTALVSELTRLWQSHTASVEEYPGHPGIGRRRLLVPPLG